MNYNNYAKVAVINELVDKLVKAQGRAIGIWCKSEDRVGYGPSWTDRYVSAMDAYRKECREDFPDLTAWVQTHVVIGEVLPYGEEEIRVAEIRDRLLSLI